MALARAAIRRLLIQTARAHNNSNRAQKKQAPLLGRIVGAHFSSARHDHGTMRLG